MSNYRLPQNTDAKASWTSQQSIYSYRSGAIHLIHIKRVKGKCVKNVQKYKSTMAFLL